jgi:cytosine/adenosine deaminase-related metal-dependent hydrolase
VTVVGLHLDEGYCVRFPTQVDGEPLETWEDWSEADFLADEGTIASVEPLSQAVLAEAREVLNDAEDGCHLHLHEGEE